MNKNFILLAFVLVVLSTTVVVGFIKPVKAQDTIYIRPDGSIEGTTDISTVDNVTYCFTNNINDSIVVQRDNIVVDGAGYTLQGTGAHDYSIGIDLTERSNVTIKNMEIIAFYYCIYLNMSSRNTISGNTITASTQIGIFMLSNSSRNIISGNNITNNLVHAIRLSHSSNNTISGNNMVDNDDGIGLGGSSNYNIISGNNITTKWPTSWWGINLFGSSGNTLISGNTITGFEDGITLEDSSNNIISENKITGNDKYGIEVRSHLSFSSNNTISGNNITANNNHGILLSGSSTTNNSIFGNHLTNNLGGIALSSDSNYNSISGNNIANNSYGIYLGESSNNKFYHNNFIDNTQQVYDFSWDYTATPSINLWDDGYPSGGNYWSNYPGVDSDHDGIGDSPHIIDENNQDSYPLMGMFSDFNATSEYHVQTICNSTISDFQFNGTAIGFYVTGEDGTTGFCRICIPTALMSDTFKVYVNGTEVLYTLLPFSNSTHSYLYFTYNHSTQEVIIIPEFPTWTSMLLMLIVLTVAIAICKRRLPKTPIH